MADMIYRNGTVLTMDGPGSAQALALAGSRILAVGSDSEVLRLRSARTRVVDLDGACLLPGFHDAHVHLLGFGLLLDQLDLTATRSAAEALQLVAAGAAAAEHGEWLLGKGFPLAGWASRSGVTAAALDAVTGSRPVLLRSQDLHSAWLNSAALQQLGFTAGSADPDGGTIVRDEAGNPSGLLLERAAVQAVSRLPELPEARLQAALQTAAQQLARLGITTVHDMAMEPARHWRMLAGSASRADFPVRVWACIDQEHIEQAAAIGVATGQGGSNFMIGGAKFFVDGALGSRTALMLEPYEGTHEQGVAVHGRELLAERIPLALAAGLTPVAHAIGDAAAQALLDVLEATAADWQARGLRPRLEHAQHLAPSDVQRLARLGVIASMQPIHLTFDAPLIPRLLGTRSSEAFMTRQLQDAGVRLAFGSDVPVAPPDVLAGLRAATQRRAQDGSVFHAEQALQVTEALAAFTSGAAWAIGREASSGRLSAGFDADLVVLSADPRAGLDGLEVLQTVKGGRATFEAAAFEAATAAGGGT
jgi:predicted amidohydrolase YtcJ